MRPLRVGAGSHVVTRVKWYRSARLPVLLSTANVLASDCPVTPNIAPIATVIRSRLTSVPRLLLSALALPLATAHPHPASLLSHPVRGLSVCCFTASLEPSRLLDLARAGLDGA